MATAPFPPARAARIAAHMLDLHSPGEIAEAVSILLDLLDLIDPDPEGPDFTPVRDGRPGDPADHEPGGDDEGGAYAEWHRQSPAARRIGPAAGAVLVGSSEDDEDDDPDTGVEDGPKGFDPEEDCCPAGDDAVFSGSALAGGSVVEPIDPGDPEHADILSYGVNQTEPAPSRVDDGALRRPHRDRVRRTSCARERWGAFRLVGG